MQMKWYIHVFCESVHAVYLICFIYAHDVCSVLEVMRLLVISAYSHHAAVCECDYYMSLLQSL